MLVIDEAGMIGSRQMERVLQLRWMAVAGQLITVLVVHRRCPYTVDQRTELTASRASLDALLPHGSVDLERVFANESKLIEEAAKGRTANALRMMQLEGEMRQDPALRDDVFVQRWQALDRQRRLLLRNHEITRANQHRYRAACRRAGLTAPASAKTRRYHPAAVCDGPAIVTVTPRCAGMTERRDLLAPNGPDLSRSPPAAREPSFPVPRGVV